ncbi:MAG: hypothetical protein PHV51_07305 [Methanosarcinaceae archaeon]|nr:hypothetical protein [Methanosarcinaceae archaeon]
MDNLVENLTSYLFIFLGLICGLLFMFPVGWAIFLFCVLTEPGNTVFGHHIKKKHAIVKKS